MKRFVINEEFLQSLDTLHLYIRNNVAGAFGGNSKSKSYGSSSEFTDFREYIPGDDIDRIDWNAFARFDKLYMKLYLDERQMHTRIYIDASRSMEYGEGEKAAQAIRLAAAFAYISVCNMDKVSIYSLTGDDDVTEVVSGIVGKEAFMNSIGKLNDIEFGGDPSISDAIMPRTVGYGDGMSVIISDFLTDKDYEKCIDHLASRRRDVVCIQILDKEELRPSRSGRYHLFDSEDIGREYRKNIDRDILAAYRAALEYVTGKLENFCEARGAKYLLLSSDAKLSEVFLGTLTAAEVVV